MLVRFLLSVRFRISPIRPSETNYVGSTPFIVVYLYSANQAFGNKLHWFDSCSRYVSVLTNQAFGNKLRWFDFCYRFISVFSQSGLRKQTTLFRLLLSVYFFIQPIRPSDTNYVGSTPAIGVFLYLANKVFGHKIRWFDS
jgi:hypothetical protein